MSPVAWCYRLKLLITLIPREGTETYGVARVEQAQAER